ncbi:DUF6252 family protein [Pontibacter sp. H249]|uniref:DUF6252 family protein n=1 Tax=Pontibacter sp. H249 TaxID=3133420 RepID=UPI0030BF92FE
MKHFLCFIILLLLAATSCKKEKVNPVDLLPAATQEGRNTFGCLVNGAAFTPKGSVFSGFGGPIQDCYYQFVRGGFHFHVSATDKSKGDVIFGVDINTDSLEIKEGAVISLTKGNRGEASGSYIDGSVYKEYRTSYGATGELTITRLDEEKQIVSGTFWFDAVNKEGAKVEVREGRFDMKYHK